MQEIDAEKMTQSRAAWLLSRTPRFLRDSDAPRNDDGTYHGRNIVAWLLAHEAAKATSDPLLVGNDSPNLERYRKAKAELAEMDAGERRERLVDMGALLEWWQSEVAPVIRKAIEGIERQWPEAAKIITAAIESAAEKVEARKPEETNVA